LLCASNPEPTPLNLRYVTEHCYRNKVNYSKEIPVSTSVNLEVLRYLSRDYSRRLGARRAPRVRITSGPKCSYHPFLNLISMSAELLERGSAETCQAILAHEVGHSVQPELRQRAWCLWGYIACIVYSCLPLLAVVWTGVQGMAGYVLVMSSLPIIPVIFWLTMKHNETFETSSIALELEADQYSAHLVGREAAYNAFVEYSMLFCYGMTDKVGELRLDRLAKPWLNRPARKVDSRWHALAA
jgi:hypothetical protein